MLFTALSFLPRMLMTQVEVPGNILRPRFLSFFLVLLSGPDLIIF